MNSILFRSSVNRYRTIVDERQERNDKIKRFLNFQKKKAKFIRKFSIYDFLRVKVYDFGNIMALIYYLAKHKRIVCGYDFIIVRSHITSFINNILDYGYFECVIYDNYTKESSLAAYILKLNSLWDYVNLSIKKYKYRERVTDTWLKVDDRYYELYFFKTLNYSEIEDYSNDSDYFSQLK